MDPISVAPLARYLCPVSKSSIIHLVGHFVFIISCDKAATENDETTFETLHSVLEKPDSFELALQRFVFPARFTDTTVGKSEMKRFGYEPFAYPFLLKKPLCPSVALKRLPAVLQVKLK